MRKERLDDIVVADMEVDKVADMVADKKERQKSGRPGVGHGLVADMEVDKVADMVADRKKEWPTWR